MNERPEPLQKPLPKRPYSYSLLVNLGLAALLFGFAWLLSGMLDAIIYATFYFVVALSWTWFRLRRRIAEERE